MGLTIVLQDELGKALGSISDSKNFLHSLLEPHQGGESVLAEIDWYGDTTFNHLQIPRFLSGWRSIIEAAKTPEEQELLESVRGLAIQCQNEDHLYLKFVGD